jgi:hypothetical protein
MAVMVPGSSDARTVALRATCRAEGHGTLLPWYF